MYLCVNNVYKYNVYKYKYKWIILLKNVLDFNLILI